jgi:hypothetical protein
MVSPLPTTKKSGCVDSDSSLRDSPCCSCLYLLRDRTPPSFCRSGSTPAGVAAADSAPSTGSKKSGCVDSDSSLIDSPCCYLFHDRTPPPFCSHGSTPAGLAAPSTGSKKSGCVDSDSSQRGSPCCSCTCYTTAPHHPPPGITPCPLLRLLPMVPSANSAAATTLSVC